MLAITSMNQFAWGLLPNGLEPLQMVSSLTFGRPRLWRIEIAFPLDPVCVMHKPAENTISYGRIADRFMPA